MLDSSLLHRKVDCVLVFDNSTVVCICEIMEGNTPRGKR